MTLPFLLAALLLGTAVDAPTQDADRAAAAELNPRADLRNVGIEEHLDAQVPPELEFLDQDGKPVRLGQLFKGDKPVVLTLVYYQCPMLCNLVLSGVAKSLSETGLQLGRDFRVVTVSIDPTETPAMALERKRGHVQSVGWDPATPDWEFLTGRPDQIRALAEAVGFKYSYDAQLKQYAHAAAFFVLTPEGKISRYLYGVQYPSRDVRLSVVEASEGRVGTSFDRVLLTCYRYDPASRRYAFFVSTFLRVGGGLIFLGIAGLLVVLWRRELKKGTV